MAGRRGSAFRGAARRRCSSPAPSADGGTRVPCGLTPTVTAFQVPGPGRGLCVYQLTAPLTDPWGRGAGRGHFTCPKLQKQPSLEPGFGTRPGARRAVGEHPEMMFARPGRCGLRGVIALFLREARVPGKPPPGPGLRLRGAAGGVRGRVGGTEAASSGGPRAAGEPGAARCRRAVAERRFVLGQDSHRPRAPSRCSTSRSTSPETPCPAPPRAARLPPRIPKGRGVLCRQRACHCFVVWG